MPKSTFFNLPQEKKERLLQAAKKEFSRVSLNEASINRIITDAEIPRGSFYMYFEDKKDLFYLVVHEYSELISKKVVELLERENGDIFVTCIDFFDTTITYAKVSRDNLETARQLFANMRVVSDSKNEVVLHELFKLSNEQRQRILQQFNTSCFKYKDHDSMLDLQRLLGFTTRTAIQNALSNMDNIENVRNRFINTLNMIQFGAIDRNYID